MKATLTADQYDELESMLDEGDLRPDYSGRGMYGVTCLGFTTDGGPGKFQMQLAKILAPRYLHLDLDYGDPDLDEIEETLDALGDPNCDSMGLSTIYYYRSIQVEGHVQAARF